MNIEEIPLQKKVIVLPKEALKLLLNKATEEYRIQFLEKNLSLQQDDPYKKGG